MLNKYYYKYFMFVFSNSSSKVFSFTFSQICVFDYNYVLFTFDGLFGCFSSVTVITPLYPILAAWISVVHCDKNKCQRK